MSKVRAIVLFTIVIGVAFGTAAAKDTPFLQSDGTTDQVALLVPFLAYSGDVGIDTALSVSNILGAPDGIFPTEGMTTDEGAIEIYVFTADGEMLAVETEDNTLGNGVLTDDGMLQMGRTWTALLSEVLAAAGALPDPSAVLTGYAWVVADFDAAQGTATVIFPDLAFTQSLDMQPTITVDNLAGGIPVVVP
jgi:hypothetical protein